MIQVINDPNRQSFGESAVNSLSSVLQGLAQQKIGEIQAAKQYKQNLQGLKALNVENAEQLAGLPSNILDTVFKQKLEEPGQIAYANALASLLGGEQIQQPVAQQPQTKKSAFPTITPNQKAQLQSYLKTPEAQKKHSPAKIRQVQELLQRPEVNEQPQEQLPIQPQKPKIPSLGKLNAKQATEIAKLGLQTRKEERVLAHKEKVEAQKETKKYYDQILAEDKSAKEADDRLNKMEKLVKKGDLPNSAVYSILKNIEEHVTPTVGAAAGSAIGGALGLAGGPLALPAAATGAAIGAGIGAIVQPVATMFRYIQRKTSPDTEEFEKLSNQFIQGAKAVFGSRITDQDLKAYMAQIPTLANTDAGKLKIIEDMKIANKAIHLRAKTMKQIIRENAGSRPADLPLLVEERIGGQLDDLSREFVEA